MGEKIKIKVGVLHGNKIIWKKGVFDFEKRLASVKHGFFSRDFDFYQVNPNHILDSFKIRRKKVKRVEHYVFVDGETGKSIKISSKGAVSEDDLKDRLRLKYLSKEAFWLAIIKRAKIGFFMVFIIALAGIGIWQLIRLIFASAGVQVP